MKRFIFSFSLLLCASPAWAAITYDTASSTSADATTTTHDHTVAADANIAIACVAQRDTGGAVGAATGATIGGEAMTLITSGGLTHSGSVLRLDVFYKLAPLTGTQSVVATGHANTDAIVTGVITLKGAAQTDTFNTTDTAQGTGTDASIIDTASAVGELVVGCFNVRTFSTTLTAEGTAPVSTERWKDSEDEAGATNGLVAAGYTEAGAATDIDMRVTLGSSVQWEGIAVSIRAAAEATRRPIAPMVFQ
jgi:hypothetical protein